MEVIRQHRDAILQIAARHGASNVRVFGSVARGSDSPESDVDILVEFEHGRDYFDQAELLGELRELLGREVDVVNASELRASIRDEVLSQAIAV